MSELDKISWNAMTHNSYKLRHTEESDSKEPFLKCRYVVVFIGFIIALMLSINRTIMSVAIVAMVNKTAITHLSEAKSDSCPSLIINVTEEEDFYLNKKEGEFLWSPKIQGYVLGSYFIGCLISQLPTGILAERYGCKWFLFSASLITGAFTLLIPAFSWMSPLPVIAAQTMRGLAQGFVQPALAVLTSNWFPKQERGFLYSFMMSATSLGTALGSIFTGYVCELPGGWPYSFYIVGAAGLVLSFSILIFVTENPKVHPRISKVELDFIVSNQENTLNKKRPKRPWRSILTSIPVYAFIIGYLGHVWAISQFFTVQSTFLGTILHYPIAENGVFTAVPFLVMFLVNQLGSWISLYLQKNNIASVNFLRKFWTFISGSGFSACLLGMYFAGCYRSLSVSFGIASMGFIGFGTSGILIVAADMTPTFAGSLQAINYTIGYLAIFILPVIVGYLTDKKQTMEQWNKVFFISIGFVMISKIIFLFFGSADVQSWNFVEECTQNKKDKQTENSGKYKEREKYEEKIRF